MFQPRAGRYALGAALALVVTLVWINHARRAERADRLETAQAQLDRGVVHTAETVYRSLVWDFGSDAELEARLRLTGALLRIEPLLAAGQLAAASQQLQQLDAEVPDQGLVKYLLARCYRALGDGERATRAEQAARALAPGLFPAPEVVR